MSDKLKIDMDFLDEESQEKDKVQSSPNDNTDFYNKKNNQVTEKKIPWWWIIFIWIIFVVIFSDSDSSSSSSSSSTSNNYNKTTNYSNTATDDINYDVWDYMCRSYPYKKAGELQPKDPWLQLLIDELDRLEKDYKNTPVDNYSQTSLNNYNGKIDNYNKKYDVYEAKRLKYNREVDIYNTYLEDNCTKK